MLCATPRTKRVKTMSLSPIFTLYVGVQQPADKRIDRFYGNVDPSFVRYPPITVTHPDL